jgi:hypothetical protein
MDRFIAFELHYVLSQEGNGFRQTTGQRKSGNLACQGAEKSPGLSPFPMRE